MANYSYSTSSCAAQPSFGLGQRAVDFWIASLIGLGLAGLTAGFLLRSTVSSMVSIWYGSNTFSYGFVVVPICALLAWRRRKELSGIRPTVSPIGLALLALFAVIWLAGNIADVQLVQQFALVGIVDALVWAFLGTQAVRILRFPLLFLFFAVPVGESLIEPLQRLTAAFTVNAVRLSGIPAVQDGFVLSTPSGDWKIAEACSGIRYLISSIVVGCLVAGVAFRTWKRRLIFVLISASVPVLANALRAYLIVVLAYVSNNRIASGVDHIIYGWIFFSLVTAILIGFALRWREPEVLQAEAIPDPVPPAPARPRNARLIWCAVAAILTVAAATFISDFLWSRNPSNPPDTNLWSIPADWVPVPGLESDWAPNFKTVEMQAFTKDARQVSLYVASDTRKRRGVDLVNSSNAAGTSGEWELLTAGYREVDISGKLVRVDEYLIASGGQRRLVWTWYWGGDQLTNKPYRIKWMQAAHRLAGHPVNIFLFAISTSVGREPSEAAGDLQEFAQGMSFQGLASSPLRPAPGLH